MSFKGSNILVWIISGVALFTVYNRFFGDTQGRFAQEIPISEFINLANSGGVKEASVTPTFVVAKVADDKTVKSVITPYYTNKVIDLLTEKGVRTEVKIETESRFSRIVGGLLGWLPMILFLGIWIYMFRKSSGSGGGGPGKIFGFGKNKAKKIDPKDIKVRLKHVAGIDEAKAEVQEIIDFLKDPRRYIKVGAKIPKGCLLYGSPGTGKTMLAKAMAGESAVPFFHISGSDFVEMFVGVGASRVREMFTEAKENAPCILFIDEIDAVGRHRGSGVGGGNDEREQTLNQMLVEMDGFDDNIGVVVVAATNRPDVLDRALLRPGRFDRQISISKPDIVGREQILKVHVEKVAIGPDVDLQVLARGTPGFSGAELANLVNEAALVAGRVKKLIVTMSDFEAAKDKILLGTERKALVMKDEEKKLTAYHEGGHALVSIHSAGSDPIHKATIIPRGRALGLVMRFPLEDKFSMTRQTMLADLAVAMAGRAAEELIFGYDKVTSGAMSDIKHATELASAMVKEWGMSESIGLVLRASDNQYGVDNTSEDTKKVVDSEVKRFVTDAYNKAMEILIKHRDQLEVIAQALLKYETLSGDEITDLLAGREIRALQTVSNTVISAPKTNDEEGGTQLSN